tara:strand:+ start:222459 stop:224951 length:2493 start_codon:yes stop_codon:yes gene_type:complete
VKKTYQVKGMMCNGCRSHVEEALNQVNGVNSAKVDLESGSAEIDFDTPLSTEVLKEAVANAGSNYRLLEEGEEDEEPHSHQHSEKPKKGIKTGNYYCPMQCEGDKTYDEPGDCPVCGMDLVEEVSANDSKTTWTCPMHPEVEEDEPGSCPKCGMDLVPKEVEESAEEKKYKQLLTKFWLSVAFTLPIFLIAMSDMLSDNPIYQLADIQVWNWVQFVLSLPVIFYTTRMFFERAWRSIKTLNLNMFTLIGIGAGIAWGFSVFGLLFPDFFPPEFKTSSGTVHLYFESATVILTLVLLGQVLEAKAHSKTNDAIKSLMKLAPSSATRVLDDGTEEKISIDKIRVDDRLKVKPGDKVPVDGIIEQGHSTIDESAITGEPVPVDKNLGDEVRSGTINGNGSFIMLAKVVGDETLLSQIVEMVNKASRSRAPIQNLADKISSWFVPTVISVSIITYFLWANFGPEPANVYALVNAIAVLIIACPCALGLATPMSVMVGVGKGAQNGILIKNAEALERLNEIDTLVIDKTGTITVGKPSVETIQLVDPDADEKEVLQKFGSLSNESEHPLSEAITSYIKQQDIALPGVTDFESTSGKGISGRIENDKVASGNARFLNIDDHIADKAKVFESQGKTITWFAINTKPVAFAVISDAIKPESKEAINQLHQKGIRIVMMTGDNESTARSVAKSVGIDEYEAQCLPEDKIRKVEELQQAGKKVCVAGDGTNDAPALAAATIGVAMGTGTDIAIETAEITLVNGDLKALVKAFSLSDHVLRNIRQNLFFALIYNTIGVPVAAGILFPFFGVLLSPMIAALAMSFSSVSVISNSLRLKSADL